MSRNGWEFYSKLVGSDIASRIGSNYVDKVEEEIEKLVNELVALKSNQSNEVLAGFVAEHWNAGTFNVNAVAAGSGHRTFTLGSTEYGSVDIGTNFGSSYSSKVYGTAEKSVVAQSIFDRDLQAPKYVGQERLIPSDQLIEGRKIATTRANKNLLTRPEVSKGYEDTSAHLTDRVTDGEVESNPLTKDEYLRKAKQIKNDDLSTENIGVSPEDAIKVEYIINNAMKAGATTAMLTIALQVTPEIIKVINYLIKNKQIDINQVKKVGLKALTSGAEGFLRGSISCALLIAMESGKFGIMFKNVNPTVLASVVTIVLETVKNSILVAAGRMTKREMGMKFLDSVVLSTGFIACMSVGGKIGALIGFQAPIIGYLIGSMLGCTFAAVYQIGKNKLISLCIDTGFTCFGLVEQNYELPKELVEELGIDAAVINRTIVNTTDVNFASVNRATAEQNAPLISYKTLKRGLIGVNKIGYIYE